MIQSFALIEIKVLSLFKHEKHVFFIFIFKFCVTNNVYIGLFMTQTEREEEFVTEYDL